MVRGRTLYLFAVAICALGASVGADVITIPDVPSYIWYHGCGPTAAGMIIGYWDAHGYENLIQGSNDWTTNNYGVKLMIASPGHILQYVPTPDCNTIPHDDNCVADFNHCSRDWLNHTTAYGWSGFYWQDDGLRGYAAYQGYTEFSAFNELYWDNTFWTWYKAEIDAERPVELLVDSDGNGASDHFVTGIGYDNTPDALRYAFYDTWDHDVHWYEFQMCLKDELFGIYGGTRFLLTVDIPEPASAGLLAAGVLWLLALGRRVRRAPRS
ncbi:MAG TPA: hypothetical protein VM537_06825 [Anaerolineae bacterium]|nr:hypothetical protein [Anaerolineae bacterium]